MPNYSPDVTTRTVFGQYLQPNGQASVGTVTISPSSEIVDPSDSVILSGLITLTLDADGKFTVNLPCTDNARLRPLNWHYEVRTRTGGARPTSMRIYLPFDDGSPVDISDLTSAKVQIPSATSTPPRGPIGLQGVQGTQGPQGSAAVQSFVHNQGTPSDTWTINHNLGFFPNVSVVDSAGTVVEGDTAWPNSGTIIVSFESAFSGKAYLS
jgi:hypothetical protein